MAETRPLPTNYWMQRKTRLLSPTARCVGVYLWTNKNTNSCGVYQISAAEIALATGYDESTCRLHMNDLTVNGHIVWDEETLEVLVLDWFRYHKFKGAGKEILRRDLLRIESSLLRELAVKSAVVNQIIEPEKIRIDEKQQLNLPTTTTTELQLQLQQQPEEIGTANLTYPQALSEDQRKLIAKEIKQYGLEEVQKALDEFAGRAHKFKIGPIIEPIAWMRQALKNGVTLTQCGLEARDLRLNQPQRVAR